MTTKTQQPTLRDVRRRAGIQLLLAGLCVAAAGTQIGCDTVAEIRFTERNFSRVVSPGVSYAGVCQDGSASTEDDTTVQLRFVLRDDSGDLIRYNDRLEEIRNVNEDSLTVSDFDAQDGRIFTTPEHLLVRCEPTNIAEGTGVPLDCIPAGGDRCVAYDPAVDTGLDFGNATPNFCRRSCGSDADCDGGSCVTGDGGVQYCAFNTRPEQCASANDCPSVGDFDCCTDSCCSKDGCTLDSGPKFCAKKSTVNLLQGQIEYISPRRSGDEEPAYALTFLMDNSGSVHGKTFDEDSSIVPARASDPSRNRIASVKSLLGNLDARSYSENVAYALWSFNGPPVDGSIKQWTGDLETGQPFVAQTGSFTRSLDELSSERDAGRSPVWKALEFVAANHEQNASSILRGRDRIVVLFTDGPDDSWVADPGALDQIEAARNQWRSQLDAAVRKLVEQEIRVYILHLDTGLEVDGVQRIQPDSRSAVLFPRDDNWRTGPLDEYQRIACATGGIYTYVKDPSALNRAALDIVDAIGGLWSLDLEVADMIQPSIPNGPYRFGAQISAQLGTDASQFIFSPLGNFSSGANSGTNVDATDNRPVIFKRSNVTGVNTNLGGAATNTELRPVPGASSK